MKKLSFLFVLIYLTLSNLNAQDIIFTFNAKDASNIIDSIRATKVETGETAFVEGSNTINMSSFTTGTKLLPTNLAEISVYPNPFENLTQLNFHSNQNDNIKISLINSAGQVIAEESQNITQGIHRFNISTKNNGLYILNVAGNQYRFSQKIISTTNNQTPNKIEYIGYSSMFKKEKSAKIEGGELVHFFVYSNGNITKIADSTTESKTYEVEFYECKDADGKSYPIVQIGEQWWKAENLAYLPLVNLKSDYSNIESKYYVNEYDGENTIAAKVSKYYFDYGVLYNWPAALAACPSGWHLPTDAEWTALENYLIANGYNYDGSTTENKIAKSLAATTNWNTYSVTGTIGNNLSLNNKSGFSALPAGCLCNNGSFNDGSITNIGSSGLWWSSTEDYTYTSFAYYWYMGYGSSGLYGIDSIKYHGFSVRCVRD